MTYQEKVAYAHRVIEAAMASAKNPAIMCSFGKDSMVVLDMVRRHATLPIIFHREAFQPHKYRFANKVIDQMGLTVYDYTPCHTAVQESGDEVEIVSYYNIGSKTSVVPTGIRAPQEGESFVCGLTDIYLKPLGTFAFPWDFVFHGHKSSDIDPIYGPIPINSDFAHHLGYVSAAYPIRFFTDEDVWRYTEENDVPFHAERYEKVDGVWGEKADKTFNPDYMAACTACMKKGGPNSVPCPKKNGLYVSNVSEQLRWADKIDPVYMRT
jgi:hypothetical protein